MNKPEIVFELIVIYLNIMSYFDDGGNGAEVWQQEEELKEWQQEHYNKFSDNKDLKDTIDMIISEIKENILILRGSLWQGVHLKNYYTKLMNF